MQTTHPKTKTTRFVSWMAPVAIALGCLVPSNEATARPTPAPPDAPERHAQAVLKPSKSSSVRGHATLGKVDDGVEMLIHVVANGYGYRDISLASADDCRRLRSTDDTKLESIGRVEIDDDGRATLRVTMPRAKLRRGNGSLVGRMIVVHDDEIEACGEVTRPTAK